MTVQPVQSNSGANSNLRTVAGYTAVGSLLGYMSKYALPVTAQEFEDSGLGKSLQFIESQQIKKFKKDLIDNMRNNKNKTQVEDVFVKMFDKDSELSVKTVKNTIREVGGEKSEFGKNLIELISQVNKYAKNKASVYSDIFARSYLKIMRPTLPFAVGGAVIGMLSGITRNVLKEGLTIDT